MATTRSTTKRAAGRPAAASSTGAAKASHTARTSTAAPKKRAAGPTKSAAAKAGKAAKPSKKPTAAKPKPKPKAAPVREPKIAAMLPADIAAAAAHDCDPTRCPCDDSECALSRYMRSTAEAAGTRTNGERTLEATEQAVADRLAGMEIDMAAMAAVSNIYRAANAVRNHVERTVLAPHDLTWTGWVVLWVVWIWGDIESRHVAAEAGISKGTLTGVAGTLMGKGLLDRKVHPDDARRVLLSLTPDGEALMTKVFPDFNAVEARVTESLSDADVLRLARSLRSVVKTAEAD